MSLPYDELHGGDDAAMPASSSSQQKMASVMAAAAATVANKNHNNDDNVDGLMHDDAASLNPLSQYAAQLAAKSLRIKSTANGKVEWVACEKSSLGQSSFVDGIAAGRDIDILHHHTPANGLMLNLEGGSGRLNGRLHDINSDSDSDSSDDDDDEDSTRNTHTSHRSAWNDARRSSPPRANGRHYPQQQSEAKRNDCPKPASPIRDESVERGYPQNGNGDSPRSPTPSAWRVRTGRSPSMSRKVAHTAGATVSSTDKQGESPVRTGPCGNTGTLANGQMPSHPPPADDTPSQAGNGPSAVSSNSTAPLAVQTHASPIRYVLDGSAVSLSSASGSPPSTRGRLNSLKQQTDHPAIRQPKADSADSALPDEYIQYAMYSASMTAEPESLDSTKPLPTSLAPFYTAPLASPNFFVVPPSASQAIPHSPKTTSVDVASQRPLPSPLLIPTPNISSQSQSTVLKRSSAALTSSPASYFPTQGNIQIPIASIIPPTPPTTTTTTSSTPSSPVEAQNKSNLLSAPDTSATRKSPQSPKHRRSLSYQSSPNRTGGSGPQTAFPTTQPPTQSATYPPVGGSGGSDGAPIASSSKLATGDFPVRRSSLLAYNNPLYADALDGPQRKWSTSLSPRRALSFLSTEKSGHAGGGAGLSPGASSTSPSHREAEIAALPAEQREQALLAAQAQHEALADDIARQADQIRKERMSKRLEQEKAHAAMQAMQREVREHREREARDRMVASTSAGQGLVSEDAAKGPITPSTSANAVTAASPSVPATVEAERRVSSPRPPRLDLAMPPSSKGKERERGGSISFLTGSPRDQDAVMPASPGSMHSISLHGGNRMRAPTSPGGISTFSLDRSTAGNRDKPVPPLPEPDRVLVGNLIGIDHVNYVLMYNMLTGIRTGVSRCEAKIKRPLTDEDYTAQHKFSFDMIGNELTPSARYDFKFKDYAPWVFRELREHFHLDPADYLLSLTSKYILSELGSPGKSGSFFYFSRDYRFIIKTISHTEHKFFRRILRDYHRHVLDNPHTLISRFYGLHRVKLPRGRKIHFVIMNNLFPPHKDIHEKYDLKGSSIGREYPEEKALNDPGAILKDLNWVHREREIRLGPFKKNLFEEQLKRDVALLQRLNIMDYSLLTGIHDMGRGNSEKLRDGMLTVFQPDTAGRLRRRPTQRGDFDRPPTSGAGDDLRRAVQRTDPKAIAVDQPNTLPDKDRSERRYFMFYQDEGGLRATDDVDHNLNTIYYLGIIDILTPYNWYKRVEHFWRSLEYDKHRISAVPPQEYGDRFLGFLLSSMRHGDKSKRPKME